MTGAYSAGEHAGLQAIWLSRVLVLRLIVTFGARAPFTCTVWANPVECSSGRNHGILRKTLARVLTRRETRHGR